MKKLLLTFLCFFFLLTGCGKKEENKTPQPDIQEEEVSLKENNHYDNNEPRESSLKSTTITDFKYPDFTIQVMGLINDNLTKDKLEGIAKYTYTINYIYKEKNLELKYDGIYLKDYIETLENKSFDRIMFTDKQGNTMTVSKTEIKDIILVFRANGNDLNEWGPCKVVVPTYNIETWLESIFSITFK